MTSRKLSWQTWVLVAVVVVGISFFVWTRMAFASPGAITISSPTTFASLDGSSRDADLTTDGTFTVNGSLAITNGGSITCNDDASLEIDASACPMHFDVLGDLTIAGGGGLYAENRQGSGHGGDIVADVGGDFSMEPGATVSARKTSDEDSAREAGAIALHVAGNISVALDARILADSPDEAGVIAIAGSTVEINGLVSSVGSPTIGRGGAISIVASQTLAIPDAASVRGRGNRTLIPVSAMVGAYSDAPSPPRTGRS
jgi:hypothetical protein